MSAYDDLYRLTTATGTALSRPGVVDRFKTTYAFDEIHNMKRLDQKHWLTTANDPTNETAHPPHTNHDFDYAYGGAGPHQATKIGDRNLVYDANGNTERECRDHGDPTCSVNADKLRRYFWGEENELTAVIDGGGWNVTRFIYDAGGQRVVKLGRGGESITVGQFFALKGRKAATKHVFIGETRLASKLLPSPGWEPSWSTGTAPAGPVTTVDTTSGCDPSTYQPQKCPIAPAANPVLDRRPDTTKIRPETYYYHSDHLGSTSWVTDQNGRVHEHVDYFPYGEVWRSPRYDSDGDPTHRQQFLFSAKEMDEETGLYYFGARYLDPVRARWVSADPLLGVPGGRIERASGRLRSNADGSGGGSPGLGSLAMSANLNSYSFAFNRPPRLSDPDGRWPRVIHEAIIDYAFPLMPTKQRDILKRASEVSDRPGNQTQARNHVHAMRSPGENPVTARREIDREIRGAEEEARAIQNNNPGAPDGLAPGAMMRWGAAGHTVMDRTSPTHTDAAGNPMEGSGIPMTPAEARQMRQHVEGERTITPAQMTEAVARYQESFRRAFGDEAANAAMGVCR